MLYYTMNLWVCEASIIYHTLYTKSEYTKELISLIARCSPTSFQSERKHDNSAAKSSED